MSKPLTRFVFPLAAAILLLGTGYLVRSVSSDRSEERLALVNGEPLYESDLPAEVLGEIRQLRHQEYQLKYRAIENAVLTRQLEAEAKRRGIGIGELIAQDVDSKVADPSDAEMESYFKTDKENAAAPSADVLAAIRQRLKKPRVDAARREYFRRIVDAAHVEVLIDVPRVEVAADPQRTRGNPAAPVQIVEFSDFQCPYCRRAQATVRALLEKYGDRVSHSFRDFPLEDLHGQARQAAVAARCAGEQSKFWEYHRLLYDNFGKLQTEDLTNHAKTLGLDMAAFESCMASGKFDQAIAADQQEGLRAGVNATPGFFINGILILGAQPQEDFERLIDTELARHGRAQ